MLLFKKVQKSQKNYSTIEKECLALVLALQHFEVYVTSSSLPIVLYSDHNPLVFIHNMKDKNQRLLMWSLMLQQYVLEIRHIKGSERTMSLLTASQECESVGRKFYKLSFLERGGCFGEHINYK